MELRIKVPREFNFARTALSHGWSDLLPFELDRSAWKLTRALDVGIKRPVTVTIESRSKGLKVKTSDDLSAPASESVTRQVKHMLRLDDDMTEFYAMVKDEENLRWVVSAGAGRMIRSPTVYEDLIKTICTTNCSWALTRKMVTSLVQKLGATSPDRRSAFPTPAAMADQSEEFYRSEISAGYRAAYLKTAAERVASGEVDVESWLTSPLPTAELKKEMKGIKGVGEYAADNLLKLLGRYDGLALDSWLRSRFAETHNNGRKATDKKIERHYKRFGEWRGLAMWCDMTRDWIEEE